MGGSEGRAGRDRAHVPATRPTPATAASCAGGSAYADRPRESWAWAPRCRGRRAAAVPWPWDWCLCRPRTSSSSPSRRFASTAQGESDGQRPAGNGWTSLGGGASLGPGRARPHENPALCSTGPSCRPVPTLPELPVPRALRSKRAGSSGAGRPGGWRGQAAGTGWPRPALICSGPAACTGPLGFACRPRTSGCSCSRSPRTSWEGTKRLR